MKSVGKIVNIADEMIIKRHNNGVKLAPAAQNFDPATMTLSAQLQLPFNVIFKKYDSVMVKMNESTAKTCGFDSALGGIGAAVNDIFAAETAESVLKNDQECMRSQRIVTKEQDLILKDGNIKRSISFRFPWYEKGKIAGIMLYGVIVGEHPVHDAFYHINQLGLLPKHSDNTPEIHPNFSHRQLQCAKLLIRGKTTREIANVLGLSARTVESYINNIKLKLNVDTKSEVIEKLLDLNY